MSIKNLTAKNEQRRRMSALTKPQRAFLGGLAAGAWRILKKREALDDGETEEQWRHREAREATKNLDPQQVGFTIREAPRFCFDELKARFEMLAGHAQAAFDTASGPSNELRNLMHNIATTAKACGVNDAYVAGICRRMFGVSVWSGEKQGKAVLVALKNKLRAMQRTAADNQTTGQPDKEIAA